MPNHARKYQLSGSLVYHIFNRSNSRAQIFFEDKDYRYFIGLLKDYSKRFSLKIYHWVIMPNHYHLLLELEEPEKISKALAGINLCYTRYHHNLYKSVGFLWQGRFKSQPVQKESYLLACSRYIERNPVRSGLVREAKDYLYSSARFYCLGEYDSLTLEDPLVSEFGSSQEKRTKNYNKFLFSSDPKQEAIFRDMDTPCVEPGFMRRLKRGNGHYLLKK